MVKKQRAQQAIGGKRALDPTSTRRSSHQAAGGHDIADPIVLDAQGRRTVSLGGNLFVNGGSIDQRVGGGLAMSTGAPSTAKQLVLDVANDGSITVKNGKVSATPKASQVVNDGTAAGADVAAALERLYAAMPTFTYGETPAGAVDGVNVTFTLVAAPTPPQSLQLFLNGVHQSQAVGDDYTLSGATITFEPGNVPAVGSSIRAASYQI